MRQKSVITNGLQQMKVVPSRIDLQLLQIGTLGAHNLAQRRRHVLRTGILRGARVGHAATARERHVNLGGDIAIARRLPEHLAHEADRVAEEAVRGEAERGREVESVALKVRERRVAGHQRRALLAVLLVQRGDAARRAVVCNDHQADSSVGKGVSL